MIRGEWKPRGGTAELQDDSGDDDDAEVMDEDREEQAEKDLQLTEQEGANTPRLPSQDDTTSDLQRTPRAGPHPGESEGIPDDIMQDLTTSMSSLNLVPPSIRFGRGGKNGGFVHRGGHPAHANAVGHEGGGRGTGQRGTGRGREGSNTQVNGNHATRAGKRGTVNVSNAGRDVTEGHPQRNQSDSIGGEPTGAVVIGRGRYIPRGLGRGGVANVVRGRGRGRGRARVIPPGGL